MPKCPICESVKVAVNDEEKVVRCATCGWSISKTTKLESPKS